MKRVIITIECDNPVVVPRGKVLATAEELSSTFNIGTNEIRRLLDYLLQTIESVPPGPQQCSDVTLRAFMQDVIEQLIKEGHNRTAETYASALNSFSRFCRDATLPLCGINKSMMERYEIYLLHCGLSRNTTSFYMRILRAVYNRAVDSGLVDDCKPFKTVYTGVAKTEKRAISLDDVRRISSIDLSQDAVAGFARDMFMFSFYTRGMSFVDIAYLSQANIVGNYIEYQRRKTRQTLAVKLEPCIRNIIQRYSDKAVGGYLFPIIGDLTNVRKSIARTYSLINKHLKRIAAQMGLAVNLTMYVARHTWASLAKANNVPLAVISDGMGHRSQNTTQIYLAQLDNEIIDTANEKILNLLNI
ncbi:MAG: tyrosine-type recombinase/integrase [Candidatus Limisoma sp.]